MPRKNKKLVKKTKTKNPPKPKSTPNVVKEDESDDENEVQTPSDDVTEIHYIKCPHLHQTNIDMCRKFYTLAKIQIQNDIPVNTCKDCSENTSTKGPRNRKKNAKNQQNKISPEDLRLCLMCGACLCSQSVEGHIENHVQIYKKHCLVVQPKTWKCWCMACDLLLPLDSPQLAGVHQSVLAIQGKEPQETKEETENYAPQYQYQKQNKRQQQVNNNKRGQDVLGMKGLNNLGNTCYFNSVLQSLAQTVPFLHHFVTQVWAPHLADRRVFEGPLSRALRECLRGMWSVGNNRCYNPRPLLNEICKRSPRFRGNRQQDAQELLRILLDGLVDEEKKVQQKLLDLQKKYLEGDTEITKEEEKNKLDVLEACEPIYENTPVFTERVFEGKVISIVTCHKCGYQKKDKRKFFGFVFAHTASFFDPKRKDDDLRPYTIPQKNQ